MQDSVGGLYCCWQWHRTKWCRVSVAITHHCTQCEIRADFLTHKHKTCGSLRYQRFGDLALHEILSLSLSVFVQDVGCLFFPSLLPSFSHNVCERNATKIKWGGRFAFLAPHQWHIKFHNSRMSFATKESFSLRRNSRQVMAFLPSFKRESEIWMISRVLFGPRWERMVHWKCNLKLQQQLCFEC